MTYKHDAPIFIAEIATPVGGLIGITCAPGKKQAVALSGQLDRDLATDLDAIASWNAAAIVSLIDANELAALEIGQIGEEARRRSMEWQHWPIADYEVPDAEFFELWEVRAARLLTLLRGGHRILFHCKGGLGRSGMISARLLVEAGEQAEVAIERVRTARPGAIETFAQEAWVRHERGTDRPSRGNRE